MKILTKWKLLMVIFLLVSALSAQVDRQTGVIRGRIMDNEGNPIPGMNVTARSPALLGTVSDVTSGDGIFRLPGLPPGIYTVTAELQGFKTVKQEGIIVGVGQVITINLQTEPSAIQEEITVVATAPTVDVQSTKIANPVTSQMLQRLPLNRSLTSVLSTVAGANGPIVTYQGSIHGASPTTVTFELDGVNTNCPTTGGNLYSVQYDAMEEIEIATGGLPAQVGITGGSFVNVVTKSGGNTFHGMLQAFYTRDSLNEILFREEQLRAMGLSKPGFDLWNLDSSGQLGGPIIRDKIWFFTGLSYVGSSRHIDFIPAVLHGKEYKDYNNPASTLSLFFKLTPYLGKNYRFFLMFSGDLVNRDCYDPGSRRTYDSTFTLKNNWVAASTANLTWLPTPNTFVDFRAGYVNRWFPIQARPGYENNISYQDYYTGYIWNGVHTWESYITRRTYLGSVRLTHFQDNFLGGDHEIGAGVEYQWGFDRYGYARKNPMTWYYYNGNPYYYRAYYNLPGPHPVFGDGLLSFTNCGPEEGDSWKDLIEYRLSGYFQDIWTIKNRFSLNLGVRIDSYEGWGGKAVTTGYPEGLPFAIGKILEPTLGFNPYGAFEVPPIKDVFGYFELSPRVGLTYDIFGNGRTAFKIALSRYVEHVPVMWFSSVSPAVMAQYYFYWWDLNKNGQPDLPGIDKYEPRAGTVFSRPDPEYLKSTVDPNKSTPYYWEFVTSINHELFKNFALKVQYIFKRTYKVHGWGIYDKATERYWYKYENAPEWWVPFKTVVPAYGAYPAQEVTLYFPSRNSPWVSPFYRAANMPDSKRVYHGFEITFDKRYADGWSLGGSLVYSRAKYFGGGGGTPNDYINGYGYDTWDIPLAIKLYGTFEFPYKFIFSFYYRFSMGSPYGRGVTVVPPAAWATAKNVYPSSMWVRLEPSGTRRTPNSSNIDVRVEKEFKIGFGRLGVFLDIYNFFGDKTVSVGYDPGGTWYPTSEGVTTGSYVPAYAYGRITGASGVRTYKFSFRFSF